MSKSTLSITVKTPYQTDERTIKVPYRLPEAFNFKSGGRTYSVEISSSNLSDAYVYRVEHDTGPAPTADEFTALDAKAQAILTTIKATLGIAGHVPPGSPLPAIALAYEAECAAYEAQMEAMKTLPMALRSPALMNAHPSEREWSGPVVMLAKYVEHVFENAAKAVAP